MRGQTTTVKPEPVPDVMCRLLARNADTAQVQAVRSERVGTTFEKLGLRYRIFNVFRDDLRRLIIAGQRIER